MRVAVRPYRDLQPAELDEWKRLATKGGRRLGEARLGSELRWADLDAETDYLIRLWDDEELRACAWVTRRTVRVSGRDVPVAGIRGVVTAPDQRRRGYGRAVMDRAHELMRSFADVEFALLFSSVMAVPFYEALGWRSIPGPVTCDQPSGRLDYTETLPIAPVMALRARVIGGAPRRSGRRARLPVVNTCRNASESELLRSPLDLTATAPLQREPRVHLHGPDNECSRSQGPPKPVCAPGVVAEVSVGTRRRSAGASI